MKGVTYAPVKDIQNKMRVMLNYIHQTVMSKATKSTFTRAYAIVFDTYGGDNSRLYDNGEYISLNCSYIKHRYT